MHCDERNKLLVAYNECVNEWADAVQRLREQAGSDLAIHLPLLSAVEEAKARAAEAKARYEMHRAEHVC